MSQGRADHTRIAMVQARHGIVEVREPPGPGLLRRHARLEIPEGMPQLRDDPQGAKRWDERQVPLQLRCECHDPDGRQRVQGLDLLQGSRPDGVGLGAQLPVIEEGAFEVNAQHPGASRGAFAHGRGDIPEHGFQLWPLAADGGRQQARGAVAGVQPRCDRDRAVAAHDIGAAAPVDVQIDEAW